MYYIIFKDARKLPDYHSNPQSEQRTHNNQQHSAILFVTSKTYLPRNYPQALLSLKGFIISGGEKKTRHEYTRKKRLILFVLWPWHSCERKRALPSLKSHPEFYWNASGTKGIRSYFTWRLQQVFFLLKRGCWQARFRSKLNFKVDKAGAGWD